jgi:D-aminoacyl-tRNA deacylase
MAAERSPASLHFPKYTLLVPGLRSSRVRIEERVRDHAMRVVLQRVTRASVTIEGQITGAIHRGFCLLVGFTHGDSGAEVDWMAEKIGGLRLFPDAEGKMNLGLREVDGSLLVISQFTLYADVERGRRPSFIEAARPETAVPLYEGFLAALRSRGFQVAAGRFGADMLVEIHNDGPVTLLLERSA